MPISRREFEKGEADPTRIVLEFFRSHPDMAYSGQELLSSIEKNVSVSEAQMTQVLESLRKRGWISAKAVRGTVYYIRRGIGFTAWEGCLADYQETIRTRNRQRN